jgi:formylglycine-generating enzyme required for sulfatase activity
VVSFADHVLALSPHSLDDPWMLPIYAFVILALVSLASVHAQDAAPLASSNSLAMKLVPIPSGEFEMGSTGAEKERFDNELQHRVRISKPFLLGATPVTVAQFAEFVKATNYVTAAEKEGWAYGAWNVKENKWDKLDGASWRKPGFEQRPDHPVVSVNWHDAVAFCKWLSEKEGKTYRLPTESEWEYACRAGTTTAYFWGDNPDDGREFLNGTDQTGKAVFNLFPPFNFDDGYLHTSPVAKFKANPWGLHDMLGNTLQWCGDWWGEYPKDDIAIDPTGLKTGEQRSLRGGAFVYGPRHCRSAFRGRNSPDFRNFYIGFRVVCED